jgi:glycosyltransferase involved in cell wall biosynthesis
MRILVVSSLYPTPTSPKIVGGAEIFARQFAESLVAKGDEVEVIRAAARPGQPKEIFNDVAVYSAPVRNLYTPFTPQRSAPLRGIWHAIDDWEGAAKLVKERIAAFKPDVMQSNTLSGLTTGVWVAAREAGVPIVHTLHDYYLTCPRCSRFSEGKVCEHTCMSCRLLTVNRRRNAACVDVVVGVSQRILAIHNELGLFNEAKRRIVIRNAPVIHLEANQQLVRQNGGSVFGFIGRLTDEKGIYNLVRAFAMISDRSIKLVIAGRASDAEMEAIRTIAPDANIEFLGFVDPNTFYSQVDVVVIPSIWEDPAPLVLVEAWAAGRPVLGTPFGGMSEIIEEGISGWISSPSPAAIAESIKRIAKDPDTTRRLSDGLMQMANKRSLKDVVASYREQFAYAASRHQTAPHL